MNKRSITKYVLASVVTGLYATAVSNQFQQDADSRDAKKLYALAAGMTALTWVVAAL